jgi:hypothetical protein
MTEEEEQALYKEFVEAVEQEKMVRYGRYIYVYAYVYVYMYIYILEVYIYI